MSLSIEPRISLAGASSADASVSLKDSPLHSYREVFDQASNLPVASEFIDKFVKREPDVGSVEISLAGIVTSRGLGDFTLARFSPPEWTELELQVACSPGFSRLGNISQMTAGYSSRGSQMVHNRYEHCVDVRDKVKLKAQTLGLSEDLVETLSIAALLHDYGHPPFAHLGERVLQSFSGFEAFDHEKWGNQLIERDFAEILGEQRLKAVIGHLSKDGFSDLIKDADRASYLHLDYLSAPIDLQKKGLVLGVVDQFGLSLKLAADYQQSSTGPALVVNDFRPAMDVLSLRSALYRDFSVHPEVLVFEEFFIAAVHRAVDAGKFSAEDFIRMSDYEVIDKLLPEDQDIILEGVDKIFEPLAAIRLSEVRKFSGFGVDAEGLVSSSRSGLTEIEAVFRVALKDLLPQDAFYVAVTPDYSKKVFYNYQATPQDQVIPVIIKDEVPLSERSLSMVIHCDYLHIKDQVLDKIQQVLSGVFEVDTLNGHNDLTQNAKRDFGNWDARLFS